MMAMRHNRHNFILVLVVAAAFVGSVTAQEQNRSTVTWKLATIDDKKIVHCEKDGWDCATSFLTTARNQPDLVKYGTQINSLLDELRVQSKDKGREPVFIATPYAPFLAWCRRGESAASAEKGKPSKDQRITRKDDPDKFYRV